MVHILILVQPLHSSNVSKLVHETFNKEVELHVKQDFLKGFLHSCLYLIFYYLI